MNKTINSKICPRCNQDKPLSEFGKNKTTKSGYQSWCKKCMSEARKTSHNKKKGITIDEDNIKHNYSPLEEQFLKINYAVLSVKELALQLNRSEQAISYKLNSLGLIKKEKIKARNSAEQQFQQVLLKLNSIDLILNRIQRQLSTNAYDIKP